MIELKHIWQTYKSPDGKTTLDAVKDVSITINDGEIFGVLGRSGAGKSTLVRCINLLNRPTKGNVIVDGQDLTKLSASELRRVRHKIGMIFQSFNLVTRATALKNVLTSMVPDMGFFRVLFGLFTKEQKLSALAALDKVGILDKAFVRADQLSRFRKAVGKRRQRLRIGKNPAQHAP